MVLTNQLLHCIFLAMCEDAAERPEVLEGLPHSLNEDEYMKKGIQMLRKEGGLAGDIHMAQALGEYICLEDNDIPMEVLMKLNAADPDDMLDDHVTPIESLEYAYTVKSFLFEIRP